MNAGSSLHIPYFPHFPHFPHFPYLVLLCVALVAALPAGAQAPPPGAGEDSYPQVQAVAGATGAFECRVESRAERSGYRVYRLTYPSAVVTEVPQNNIIPAEYFVPEGLRPGGPRRPAVICLTILDGSMELVHIACAALARHGIPAVCFSLPYYGERALPGGRRALTSNARLFTGIGTQAIEDVRRTVDVLAARPEVNPERIGIVGFSLGGILAATAAGHEPRLERAALILAGGDLKAMIGHSRETAQLHQELASLPPEEREAVERAIDVGEPLRCAGRLRDRARRGKVLMFNATEDEVIPRPCTEKLAAALGIADRVIWLEGLGHYTALAELPSMLKRAVAFFGEGVPAGIEPVPGTPNAPATVVRRFLEQALVLFSGEPAEGRCHQADLEVALTLRDGRPLNGRLSLVRGAGGRFRLQGNVPPIGEVALGQDDLPWAMVGGAALLRGQGDTPVKGPLSQVRAANLVKLRVLAGGVAAVSLAPDALEPALLLSEAEPEEGRRVLRVALRRPAGTVRLRLGEDGATPESLAVDSPLAKGTLKILRWQTDTAAPEGVFAPPAGVLSLDAKPEAVHRLFASLVEGVLK